MLYPLPNLHSTCLTRFHHLSLRCLRLKLASQILDIDGGRFSWAQLQTPVGDMPTARHGHSACEVPASACYAAGVSSGLGCVLVFGGEGRTGAGLEDVRPTDSHELFLYDPQVIPLLPYTVLPIHVSKRILYPLYSSRNPLSFYFVARADPLESPHFGSRRTFRCYPLNP